MSKGSKFGFLKDRQPEAEAVSQELEVASEGSEQFGRRADPRYVQINANVPAELRRQFRVKLATDERKMQEVLELLIDGYVSGDFKV